MNSKLGETGGGPTSTGRPAKATQFRQELIAAGLLIDLGAPGVYATSAAFEAVVLALSSLVVEKGADQSAESWRFPAVFPRSALERTGYLKSFPELIGSVQVFTGGEQTHRDMLAQLESGSDWTSSLTAADVAMCSSACHPLYPIVAKHLPAGGQRYDVLGLVFRNEPSPDPARMRTFRQHEFVYIGEPATAVVHRDDWLDRATELFSELGLTVSRVVANDPFFGRAGRLLGSSQRSDALKFELTAVVGDDEAPTAIASSNLHKDHFGLAFDIRTDHGDIAHSSCIGFGLERITLALIRAHGFTPAEWPVRIRDTLWP